MGLVVADASPIRYLVLIGQIEVLPTLFEQVVIPEIVARELRHMSTPATVRAWIDRPPAWAKIVPHVLGLGVIHPLLENLDAGERAAIQVALHLNAERILIDERKASAVASRMGLNTTGTLGVLGLAADAGLIELRLELTKLTQTNFRYRRNMLDELLKKFAPGERKPRP